MTKDILLKKLRLLELNAEVIEGLSEMLLWTMSYDEDLKDIDNKSFLKKGITKVDAAVSEYFRMRRINRHRLTNFEEKDYVEYNLNEWHGISFTLGLRLRALTFTHKNLIEYLLNEESMKPLTILLDDAFMDTYMLSKEIKEFTEDNNRKGVSNE